MFLRQIALAGVVAIVAGAGIGAGRTLDYGLHAFDCPDGCCDQPHGYVCASDASACCNPLGGEAPCAASPCGRYCFDDGHGCDSQNG